MSLEAEAMAFDNGECRNACVKVIERLTERELEVLYLVTEL